MNENKIIRALWGLRNWQELRNSKVWDWKSLIVCDPLRGQIRLKYLLEIFSCRVEWLRNLKIWKHYANYFPVKLIKTTELDSNENYIFGNHPHGILCSGAFACFATDGAGWSKIFPNLIPSLLTLQIFHLVPGFREVLRPSGEFNRRSVHTVLRIRLKRFPFK